MLYQKSGCIVLMNTLDSKKGIVGDGPYVTAKAALDGLGDVLRQELCGTGVRIISVYPGRVDTQMIKNIEVPWITPKISPNAVVGRMIQGIVKNRPIVVIPHVYFSLGALNNLFPRFMDWAYRLLRLQGLEH
jgi:short-subunit dehydrogenase